MSDRTCLSFALIGTGIYFLLVSCTWILADTGGVQAGVSWLAGYTTDTYIGVGWALAGVICLAGGIFPSLRCPEGKAQRQVETAATMAAIIWPLMVAALFAIAQGTGESDTAWTLTIRQLGAPLIISSILVYQWGEARRIEKTSHMMATQYRDRRGDE